MDGVAVGLVVVAAGLLVFVLGYGLGFNDGIRHEQKQAAKAKLEGKRRG